MKIKSIASSIVTLIILILFGYQLIGGYFDVRNKKRLELAELQSVVKENILSVTISSISTCKQPFEYRLQAADTKVFLQASKGADTIGITGHSTRTFEANIEIKTSIRSVNYLATVNKQQSQDLFLSRVLSSPDREGHIKEWQYHEVRLPGMGKWIAQLAPSAVL